MMRFHLLFYVLLFTFYVLTTPTYAQVRFTEVSEIAGLDGLIQGPAGSATWGDYDNDGDIDLFRFRKSERKLYRNEGNGRFINVTEVVGITDTSVGADAATFVDFDNDGNLDLFVGSGGALGDILYWNRGDGTFLNISQMAGMKSKAREYYGALSFDYDSDGLLDIYAANWGQTTPFPNFLYYNEGNGRFREIAAQLGLDKPEFAYGIALGDYDNDGDLDLFLAVSGAFAPDQGLDALDVLYRNEGNGKFIDVAQQTGVQRKGNHLTGFFWDYDNDGDLDLFVQAFFGGGVVAVPDDFNILYRNNGNGTFTNVTQQAGIAQVKNGSAGAYYGDYDNDGWLDLCITYNNLPTFLYHNNRDGTFTDVGKKAGIGGTNTGSTSFVDYDNDGDLDIFTGGCTVSNKVSLYRNDGTANHGLKLKLVGSKSNRDGIGARIKIKAGELSMLREIGGSSGDGTSQDRLPVHFGLGKNPKANIIEIRWPSGIIQTFTNILADQQLTIDEVEGILVVVRNVFPTFGDLKGDTPIRIQGEQFRPGSKVFFGGIEAIEIRVESSSLITAVSPPGTSGLVDVEIVNPDGKRGVLKNGFRYTKLKVTRITPESGPTMGNITTEIEGFGFQSGAEVQIGGKSLTNLFVTPSLIRGTLPPGTPGVMDVSVTNPTKERDILRGAFTYNPPPTIEKISPIFVPLAGDKEIAIKGSGFIRTPSVQIGGIAARRVDFISSNELKISIPQFLAVGPQDAVVINPDGQHGVLPGGITVLAPIAIKSVEPNSGGLAGGTKITIVGEPTVEFAGRKYPSRFVKGAEVLIGDVEAEDATIQSDHIITAITPPNTPGPKDVKVINVDGQSDRLRDGFSYNPLPQIIKIIPNNGPLSGGTKITIQGSKFLPGAKVLIGDVDANSYIVAPSPEVTSDAFITAITPKVPLDEPGPRDVIVVNPDGQEVVLRDGFTYNPLPTIRDISPSYGPSSGGTKVILRGTGFLQGARVIIGKRFATTEFKDDETIEAVTPANPKGRLDVRVVNPDTQEAIIPRAFISVGELAYNYPNPFQASRGTTFRYVPGPNESVESIVVKIFNLAGVPIGVVGAEGSNEVRWQDSKVNVGLYVYLMEVKVGGKVKRFKRMLEVYK